ncbi:MAG: ATPase domain-containing protein [Candidatus Aenigmatarchaeota archaeon]|nr:AAA family ATPase [Candidatus Aenigmarchaeota archaeon]
MPQQKGAAKPVRTDEERVKVGIVGFDELVFGGLIPGNLTLVTGTTGTGKTIFGAQFIYNGAQMGQPGVYVSFEEPPENIKANVRKFGMDFESLEKAGKVAFARYDPYHVEDVYELIESSVKKIGAKRVVIDSVAALGLYIRDPAELRRMIFNIALLLRKLGCTAIITTEMLPGQRSLSRFGVEEFVSDAIIVLYYTRTDSQFARAITVWKMRGSEHTNKVHPYRITSEGIVVYPKEEAFVKFD